MTAHSNKHNRLSHVDDAGKARMVHVGAKPFVPRTAVASALVTMSRPCAEQVAANTIEKGDVLAAARLAGTMAAKRTGEMIPLCHPLRLDHIDLQCRLVKSTVHLTARVSARERTGVEMEALTAVSFAALTLLDMCKAVDPAIIIGPIRVESKVKDGRVTFDRSTPHGTS